jgi:hypothetical protein
LVVDETRNALDEGGDDGGGVGGGELLSAGTRVAAGRLGRNPVEKSSRSVFGDALIGETGRHASTVESHGDRSQEATINTEVIAYTGTVKVKNVRRECHLE